MIIKYHPRYLKAIKDITKRDGVYGPLLEVLETAINNNRDLTYIYLNDEGKFRAYTTIIELPDNAIYALHWSSKSKKEGIALAIYVRKELKKKGYEEIFFHRHGDQNIMRRKI